MEKAEIAHLCVISAWNATQKRLDLNDFISFPGWKQLIPSGNAGGYQSMFSYSEFAKVSLLSFCLRRHPFSACPEKGWKKRHQGGESGYAECFAFRCGFTFPSLACLSPQ
ncbi:MAG: hypothetical protein IJC96_03235, partial [Clostridia bacterium]|nr:hypothetical protein [Clostridia bacterium]